MTNVLDRVAVVEETVKPRRKLPQLRWNWEHAGLGAILLLAAFLGLWNLSINGYSNSYYAAAVKSMAQSWHNFFFVSFDPGGFVTVDKPPVAFWIQAAFVKVFGYSGVTMLVPEALAGVGGVFLLYSMVKRAFGGAAGLISALLLAITPIYVVMNRDNNPDSILVFTLLLAAWAMLRAAEKGHLRWLLLAGVLVGVAFNVKMLAAYVVLPAFFLMYFLFARTTWFKRVWHLAAVSVVIVAISLSWAVAVDLTPASQRPYVDSSSVNSELDLILNYNGLGRVDGNENGGTDGGTRLVAPNSATTDNTATSNTTTPAAGTATSTTTTQPTFPDGANFTPPTGAQGGGGGGFGGEAGITRLLTPQNAGEFNWFMPLALLGMIYVGAYAFSGMAKGEERSRRLQSVMLWGGWFLIYGLVFSLSKGTFHSYYLNMMAPAEAALAGIALVMLWKRYRQGGWLAWLLPIGLAATAFYQAYILTGYTSWNEWLSPVLIVVGICALIGLAVGNFLKSERTSRILVRGVTGISVAALLITPAALSVRAVFTSISGSIVSATPSGGGQGFGGQSNSNSGISTWLDFIQKNLSGQLLIMAAIVGVGVILFGLRFILKQPKLMNKATLVGVVLALLVVFSSGWWVNAAQAQPIQTNTAASGFRDGGGIGGQMNSQTDQTLINYLEANQGDYKYLVAVSNSNTAAPLIIQTGKPVMSIGGFLGSDKTITSTAQLEQMIANHTIRYFLIGGNMGGGGQSSIVSSYVQQNCTVVDYAASGSSSTQSTSNSQQLYVCTAK